MKANQQKYTLQEEMQKDLRNIIKRFKDFEMPIIDRITTNNLNAQSKIDNLKRYNLALKSDNGYLDMDLTPEMQEIARQFIIEKIESDRDEENKILTEDLDKEREATSEECKSVIDTFRQQLEDKVQAEKEKLNTIREKIEDNRKDIAELKKSIDKLKLKPESRTFKILEEGKQGILKQQKHLSEEKKIANENIKSAESELQSFDEIYGNIDFESENFIYNILKIMYGKEGEKDDYSIFLLGDEWQESLQEVQRRQEVERIEKEKLEKERLAREKAEKERLEKEKLAKEKAEKEKQEQAKRKAESKKTGQGTDKKPNPVQKPEQKPNPAQKPEQKSNPAQKPEQKPNPVQKPSQTQKPEQHLTPEEKIITKMLSRGKNKSKQYPTLIYVAEKDSYIAQGENGKIALVKRGIYSEKTVKRFISSQMGISEDELGYVDTSIVSVWMKYDDKYGTNELTKYIQSVLNPDMSKDNQDSRKVIYNLKGLYRNKNISKSDKQKILDCANYAKEFQIANVKKGFIASITETITNAIKRGNNNKLEKGKSGAEIIAEQLKNRETRKRDNKFKKEIQVTSAYKDIGRQISSSDKDGLDNILTNAREELREGKISTTEYSGLIYSANNRRKELSSAKTSVKKEPVASKPEQRGEDRG